MTEGQKLHGQVTFFRDEGEGQAYGFILPDGGSREDSVWFGSHAIEDIIGRGDKVEYVLSRRQDPARKNKSAYKVWRAS
jgi:cold shock CspA family protein